MKGYYEAIVNVEVDARLADAYKKAIEEENSRYWVKNKTTDANATVFTDEMKPIWNGNYCTVEIRESEADGMKQLVIQLISHTLPNLKQTVDWYEVSGAHIIYTNY